MAETDDDNPTDDLIRLSPENREIYEAALKKWDERLRPLTEANRRAGHITADDLNIIVGPDCGHNQ